MKFVVATVQNDELNHQILDNNDNTVIIIITAMVVDWKCSTCLHDPFICYWEGNCALGIYLHVYCLIMCFLALFLYIGSIC